MPTLKVNNNGVWEKVSTLPAQINADTVDGMHAEEFISTTGGELTGTLMLNGIVLTEGVDYGTGDPSGGVVGQLYFKKVT
jgi:hypothetical protein